MALKRPCLGCGKLGRWRHRCPRCQAQVSRRKAHARPDLHNDAAERRRRAAAVAAHHLHWGDWCLGYSERPGRPRTPVCRPDRRPDGMVGLGHPASGPPVVRCRSRNAARAAALLAIAARQLGSPHGRAANDPPPAEVADTLHGA